jgi:hypothetical protein
LTVSLWVKLLAESMVTIPESKASHRQASSVGRPWVCTNCFHQRKPVILIPAPVQRMAIMHCPACKALIQTGYTAVGPAKYAEEFLKAE